eukprot:scaffold128928_cov17-Prasinocladus_malaysianus.AAC.1
MLGTVAFLRALNSFNRIVSGVTAIRLAIAVLPPCPRDRDESFCSSGPCKTSSLQQVLYAILKVFHKQQSAMQQTKNHH